MTKYFLALPLLIIAAFSLQGSTASKITILNESKWPHSAVRIVFESLSEAAKDYDCQGPGETQIRAELRTVTKEYISFRYDVFIDCQPMPHPDSFTAGRTLHLPDRSDMPLSSFLGKFEHQKLSDLVLDRARIQLKKGKDSQFCSDPIFSQQFIIDESNIVFLEFFPDHSAEPCEIEVSVPLADLKKQLSTSINDRLPQTCASVPKRTAHRSARHPVCFRSLALAANRNARLRCGH